MDNAYRSPGRFVVIVLDGFGIGEMPDVQNVRPQDTGANTFRHILEQKPDLCLPTLERLGLMNAAGFESSAMRFSPCAGYGRAMLMHDGADTFFGHQEIMGTFPKKPFGEPFQNKFEIIRDLLREHSFFVEEHSVENSRILAVDRAVTVGDNIECDPGQAFNVTSAIDDIPFERVLEIGRLVRSVSTVPRVIAFGGRQVHLQNLLEAVERHGDYIGVNAPASGVYNHDYHCIHMGYGVDPLVQAPTILGRAGHPVYLLGKVADVVANEFGISIPMVDTAQVLEKTRDLLAENPAGFFCTNVQETDLCGHRENVVEYARKLQIADHGIERILQVLSPDDILVVMADHGNDPTIGHPHHTREMVPLLVYCNSGRTAADLGTRETLSDVGATAVAYFGETPPQNGTSFLPKLRLP